MIGGSNKMLSMAELAEFLGVPFRSVADNWDTWGLPMVRVGKHLRISERNIATWLEERQRETARAKP